MLQMSYMKKKTGILVIVLVVLGVTVNVFAENALRPALGMSFVISPDYRSVLKDSYPNRDISGGFGWLGLQVGLRYLPMAQFAITPRIGAMFNFVMFEGDDEDSFFNSIIQPALSARYLFQEGSSLYIEGEVSYNRVSTGSDHFDVDGGVGYAGLIGYQVDDRLDFGIGYSVISTEVTNRTGVNDKNFGGVEIRFSAVF